MFEVYDYYENPCAELIYIAKDKEDCDNFVKKYVLECNGKCALMFLRYEPP